jgi:hypothetical protein
VFQYISTNETQVVLYWFEAAQKYVKFSVEAFPSDTENLQALEDDMLFVAKKIVDHWEPIKLWSQITLLLSQNGDKLVTATAVVLVIVVILLVLERRHRRRANYQAYQKLSEPNKQTINAIHETEKTQLSTLLNIATTYERIIGKTVRKQKLLEELQQLENTGFVNSTLGNVQDEPIQTWKTQIAFPKKT